MCNFLCNLNPKFESNQMTCTFYLLSLAIYSSNCYKQFLWFNGQYFLYKPILNNVDKNKNKRKKNLFNSLKTKIKKLKLKNDK